MENMFLTFNDSMENEIQYKDLLKSHIKEIDVCVRKMITKLQVIHGIIGNKTEILDLCEKCVSLLPTVRKEFVEIDKLIKAESYYKYRDFWRFSMSQLVFLVTFCNWIKNETLLTIEETNAAVFGQKLQSVNVELEDYLLGVCMLPSELSRLCVNSVIAGNYELPVKISKFVGDLFSSFRLLNLKNDNIRKKFDGFKYELKKIEDIVYDLSIRKLQ